MSIYDFLASRQKFANLALVGEPDFVIEGRHCSVACYRLSKQSGDNEWHFSPSCVPAGRTFSSDTDEEWIANCISQIPDVDFFISFTSFSQVWNWVRYRDCAVNLALVFWAEEDQPYLKKELEKGQIDQFSYNYSLAEAKIYKSLWKLIQVDEAGIRKILSNNWGFPFDSSRAFFVEIVREDLEEEFCACLRRRYIYKACDVKETAKLKRKAHRGTASSAEIDRLYSLIDHHVPFATWLNRLLSVAEILSNKNPLLKECLESYREGMYTLTKLQIQRDCDPNLRHHKRRTHSWKQGQYYQGPLPWNS